MIKDSVTRTCLKFSIKHRIDHAIACIAERNNILGKDDTPQSQKDDLIKEIEYYNGKIDALREIQSIYCIGVK